MVWQRGQRSRPRRTGRRGAHGTDARAEKHMQRGSEAETQDTFPAALPPRHKDTDIRFARNTPGAAEGSRKHGADKSGGEHAFGEGTAGNRGAGEGCGDRLSHAHHCHEAYTSRGDGEVRGRSGRRNSPLIRCHDELPHNIQPARRDNARQPVDERSAGRTARAVRRRSRDNQQLLLGQHAHNACKRHLHTASAGDIQHSRGVP